MPFRLNDTERRVTREDLADPARGLAIEKRLAEASAPDLRDNTLVEEVGGEYARISPRDPSKKWTPSSAPLVSE
jgi:hypothetical protein